MRSQLAPGDGRDEEAFDHLPRSIDSGGPARLSFPSRWRIRDLAGAAMLSGHFDEARHLCTAEHLGHGTHSHLRIRALYARTLLAHDDQTAEAGLLSDLSGWLFYRARMLLEHGVWLQRRRGFFDARRPLRAVREAFDALGARPGSTGPESSWRTG